MAVTGIVNSLIKTNHFKIMKIQIIIQTHQTLQNMDKWLSPLIMVILWLALVLLVGKYLWNESL